MLADNIHALPKHSREFAQSLVANAARSGLSDRQLLETAKLIERIKREKARLRNRNPEPQHPGAKGS